MKIIAENNLSYKLWTMKEKLTCHAGLVLFGEFMLMLGLTRLVDEFMPKPLSNAGFKPSVYVNPLCS
jgi:hypothetical protein